ncbi:MAG: SDR family NAD(P)-dependent oxidoreductase [Rhodothermales bacterium]
MSAPQLDDKTAIVTGAGSGIGRAIAQTFAEQGARVAVLDVVDEQGQAVVEEIEQAGHTAAFWRCDVGDQMDVRRVFGEVVDQFGPLGVLVNNAGIAHVGNVETTTEEDFDRIYRVNVKGVYNGLQAGVRAMKGRGGAILNVASVVSVVGIPDRFAYSMSKGAVLTMTLSVACDYLAEGIRCNCISPARVHTPFVDGFLAQNYPGQESEMFEQLSQTQPIGRMGKPAEIARLAAFLCSDEAAFITGSNIPIDGGFITLKP